MDVDRADGVAGVADTPLVLMVTVPEFVTEEAGTLFDPLVAVAGVVVGSGAGCGGVGALWVAVNSKCTALCIAASMHLRN